MPTQAGIEVRVLTGRDSHKSEEYGIRHIRGRTQVSTYIESQTGARFTVGIKPNQPYYTHEKGSARTYSITLPVVGRFDFLALIYVDGCTKPEMRRVIYLDPKHPKFDAGVVHLNGRVAIDVNGNPIRLPWVFEDAWGLETVFGRMKVAGARQRGESATGKPGQVRVVLERINPVGALTVYKPNQHDSEGRDSEMGTVDEDITHMTGFGNAKVVDAPITGITSTYYRPGEGPYAVFEFLYRSAEVLAKFPWSNLHARSGRPPVAMPQLSGLSLGSASAPQAAGAKRGRGETISGEDEEGKRVKR